MWLTNTSRGVLLSESRPIPTPCLLPDTFQEAILVTKSIAPDSTAQRMIGNWPFWRCGFVLLLFTLHANVHAAQLIVSPGKLELTGRDPLHGMIVSLIDDDGKVSDVTRRVSYEMDRTDIASADERGMVTGLSDGQATLTVKLAELSAAVSVSVATIADKPAPSFKNDILPILTRCGCNMGGCHGKLAGQNGFRLSLRGYAPEWDHEWITQEVSGRRIDLGFPEKSLLLAKPSGAIPHDGGVRFRPDSRMFQTLRDWIASRATRPTFPTGRAGDRSAGSARWKTNPASFPPDCAPPSRRCGRWNPGARSGEGPAMARHRAVIPRRARRSNAGDETLHSLRSPSSHGVRPCARRRRRASLPQ